jgi:uncharacterized protein
MDLKDNHKAALILLGIAGTEGLWLAANLYVNSPARFLRFCGFQTSAGPLAWIISLGIALRYVGFAARRLPSVKEHMFVLDGLKLLAIAVAIGAGFCEEAVFRKLLMDFCLRLGSSSVVQIVFSGLAFGSAHAVWGLFQKQWSCLGRNDCDWNSWALTRSPLYPRRPQPRSVHHFALSN